MEVPDNFLGLPPDLSDFDKAGVLLLPVPMEATVSYGGGTSKGPAAILEASRQVELYDREYGREVVDDYGIHTLPPLVLPPDPEGAIQAIRQAAKVAASSGKLLVGLGGEHTITYGLGLGVLDALGGPLTLVQIDAHSDLRDTYDDSPLSHACVARRLFETSGIEDIIQLGIRSVCPEEVALVRENPEHLMVFYSDEIHAGGWASSFIQRIAGKRVYLTIDLDGLDPAIIPATGTPEPDGLTWRQVLSILQMLTHHAQVVAMDMVELAPSPGLHGADFASAKLLYKAISYAKLPLNRSLIDKER